MQLENSVFANQSFGYDLNGNRQSNGSNAYTYQPNSNRMATRKGTALSRDAAGNHTSNGLGQTYSWDNHGHFSQFTLNGVKKATYLYNHQHQRTHKTLWNGATALGTTVYHYDLQGRLLMETSSTGAILATYIYDEAGVPLGLFWESLSPPVYDEVGRFTDWAINHSFGDCVGIGNVMRSPDFINFQIDAYVGSAWGTFSRDGNSFIGGGLNLGVPNSVGISASASGGWLNQSTISPGDTNSFIAGYAGSGTASYLGVGGGVVVSSSGATATLIGFGAGTANNNIGVINGGYTIDKGYSGIAW